MTDKMPAEIWADPPDEETGIGLWAPEPDDVGVTEEERYIHESRYKRLLEAYRKNRELLRQAPCEHAVIEDVEFCPYEENGTCDCWKSEIAEVIEL